MATGANSDFLYSVGVDLTKANADLQEWSQRTVPAMLQIKPVQIQVNTSAATANLRRFAATAAQVFQTIPPINVSFNFSGASRSLNAFVSNFKRNAAAIKDLESSMAGISRSGDMLGASFDRFGAGMGNLARNARSAGESNTVLAESTAKVGVAAEKSTAAIDYLGKIAIADTAKILAWGAAFSVVEGALHGFTDAINQSAEVQMEQVLQRLYSSTIDVGQAFKNAETIAKEWGGNIVDVQQAIGLWTKQTNDLAAATMLANKGEEMARASGIATQDVYKDSLAIGTQMGLTYGQLPAVYDQIANAALKLGEKLRGVNDNASEGTEAMKDLFQGLARASATLSANSFSDPQNKLKGTAAIIAIVANQITAMGDSGKTAATNLASMFGALSQGGPERGEWEKVLGVDAFQNADTLLQSMQKHLGELTQAQANGTLGVRPQQVETLATMEKSLSHINELYHEIATTSGGKLDLVALSAACLAAAGMLIVRVGNEVE